VVWVVRVRAVPQGLPRRWVRRDELQTDIRERVLVAFYRELVVFEQLLLQFLLDSLDLLRCVLVVSLSGKKESSCVKHDKEAMSCCGKNGASDILAVETRHLQDFVQNQWWPFVFRQAIHNLSVHFPNYSKVTKPYHRTDRRNDFWFKWGSGLEVGTGVSRDSGNSGDKGSLSNLRVDVSNQVVGHSVRPALVFAQLHITWL
jgi:hypothetical protein